MPAPPEIRELARKRKKIGWIALVALIVEAMYTLDRWAKQGVRIDRGNPVRDVSGRDCGFDL
jgi:hypothetical protein